MELNVSVLATDLKINCYNELLPHNEEIFISHFILLVLDLLTKRQLICLHSLKTLPLLEDYLRSPSYLVEDLHCSDYITGDLVL